MTQPRRIQDGRTYLITRRTVLRHCLFTPDDPRIAQLFVFALAWCAARFGILVHAMMLMSTHEHLVVTDTLGLLPIFTQMFHRIVALATKVVRKWDGAVWDHLPPSVVELLTPEVIIEKIAYAIANPSEAGLVLRACDWPGVTTLIQQLAGGVVRADRPAFFFAPNNPQWGDSASLTLTLPPMLEGLYTPEQFRTAVADEVARLERAAHDAQQEKGRPFAGPEHCTRVSPFHRITVPEPIRDRSPALAAGAGRVAARIAAIHELRAFRAAYRDALTRWRAGLRDAVFPAGTWWMHRVHGAAIAHVVANVA